uniref:Uncharacterized protein n=1 Tax=Anguilla anguilla TaxID=7936 RepID=A0A0E9XRW3_ANGAN
MNSQVSKIVKMQSRKIVLSTALTLITE